MLTDRTGAPLSVWRTVVQVVVAALSAHLAIVLLTKFLVPSPLATALVATLVFAGFWLAFAASGTSTDGRSRKSTRWWDWAGASVVGFLCIWGGMRLVSTVLETGSGFYCHPAVPWRIEIALFGSFAFAYLIGAARERGWLVYPLVLLGFLWIAPFYGFFSAPIFLAISLNTACPNRSAIAVAVATMAMLVADRGGTILARMLSERSERRD